MTMSSIRKESTRITSQMDKIKMLQDKIFDYETQKLRLVQFKACYKSRFSLFGCANVFEKIIIKSILEDMAKNIQSLTFKANLGNFSLPYFHIHVEIPPQPTYTFGKLRVCNNLFVTFFSRV